jgi:uncharacterized delta-60 repeat protein
MARRTSVAVGILSAAALAMSASALAKPQPGNLDRSFGGNGVVRTQVDGLGGGADAVAIDRSRRIVAAGTTNLSEPVSRSLVARYEPNGELDPSFSGDGMRSVGSPYSDAGVRSMALGKGGAVIAAGAACRKGHGCHFAVTKLTPGGELDRGFGQEGRARIHFGSKRADASSMTIDSRGRVLVAGTICGGRHCNFALIRLKRNGELDRSFGNDGRVVTNVDPDAPNGNFTSLNAMGLDSRDRIITAGDVSLGRVALVRYKKDGHRDRSFGRHGIAVKKLDQLGGISAVAITPRDKIVAAGDRRSSFDKEKWVLARFGRSGGLNSKFGDGGEVAIDIPGEGNSFVRDVALDSNNRIVATGRPDFSVARFQPNGNLNRSFGRHGTVTKDLDALAKSVAIDSRNRPVIAGDGGTRFVVARLIG